MSLDPIEPFSNNFEQSDAGYESLCCSNSKVTDVAAYSAKLLSHFLLKIVYPLVCMRKFSIHLCPGGAFFEFGPEIFEFEEHAFLEDFVAHGFYRHGAISLYERAAEKVQPIP